MQDLFRTLQDRDLGHLRIVADLWGIELLRLVPVEAARLLANSMLDPALAVEQADSLPREARRALDALLAPPGRILLADPVPRHPRPAAGASGPRPRHIYRRRDNSPGRPPPQGRQQPPADACALRQPEALPSPARDGPSPAPPPPRGWNPRRAPHPPLARGDPPLPPSSPGGTLPQAASRVGSLGEGGR